MPMFGNDLNRIRQLSAHEIGHTRHNFAGCKKPRFGNGLSPSHINAWWRNISYANAYNKGIGDWDKVSVAYSYRDFPEGVNEDAALTKIIEQSARDGFRFISDRDARPIGGAHPIAFMGQWTLP